MNITEAILELTQDIENIREVCHILSEGEGVKTMKPEWEYELDNYGWNVCPECECDDIEPVDTNYHSNSTTLEKYVTKEYECNDCKTEWCESYRLIKVTRGVKL